MYDRRWECSRLLRGAAAREARASGTLHVVQFNILADGLSAKEPQQGGFADVPRDALEWNYRSKRLVEELFRHDVLPDIVAMQEVDHYEDWFEPVMHSLGYKGHFLSKPNSTCRRSLDPSLSDGCALFWRDDRLTLETVDDVVYDKPEGGKFNQVAILATLRIMGLASPIAVAVTHLRAAKTPEGEQTRRFQAQQLLERLSAKGLPSVVASDLNAASVRGTATAYSPEAYSTMVMHPLALRSAYAQVLGEEPQYTTWKRKRGKEVRHTIDYLFASESIRPLRVLLPPAEEDIDVERLPGWRYPSDHIALMVELSVSLPGA